MEMLWVLEDLLYPSSQASQKGVLPITHPSMTRFNITLESIEMVIWALNNCLGGEIFVPKLKSYRILDLAEAISQVVKKLLWNKIWRKFMKK